MMGCLQAPLGNTGASKGENGGLVVVITSDSQGEQC